MATKKIIFFILLTFCFVLASFDAIKLTYALYQTQIEIAKNKKTMPFDRELPAKIQKYFRKYYIYIPTEDIWIIQRQQIDLLDLLGIDEFKDDYKIILWCPFPFHFPLFGYKIFEFMIVFP